MQSKNRPVPLVAVHLSPTAHFFCPLPAFFIYTPEIALNHRTLGQLMECIYTTKDTDRCDFEQSLSTCLRSELTLNKEKDATHENSFCSKFQQT